VSGLAASEAGTGLGSSEGVHFWCWFGGVYRKVRGWVWKV
jgi:hypothetical protein